MYVSSRASLVNENKQVAGSLGCYVRSLGKRVKNNKQKIAKRRIK